MKSMIEGNSKSVFIPVKKETELHEALSALNAPDQNIHSFIPEYRQMIKRLMEETGLAAIARLGFNTLKAKSRGEDLHTIPMKRKAINEARFSKGTLYVSRSE